jgi:hypothetical protein
MPSAIQLELLIRFDLLIFEVRDLLSDLLVIRFELEDFGDELDNHIAMPLDDLGDDLTLIGLDDFRDDITLIELDDILLMDTPPPPEHLFFR